MYVHSPIYFYSSICLSFLFTILLICIDMCYYTHCILFQVFYICVIFVFNFFIILFMLVLLPHISSCLKFSIILFILVLLPYISFCLKFLVILFSIFDSYFISCHIWVLIYFSRLSFLFFFLFFTIQ